MSFSKFGFQTGPVGGVTGVGQMISDLTNAGVPMSSAASDSSNVIYDLQQARRVSGVPHQINFIPTADQYGRFDFDYTIYQSRDAAVQAYKDGATAVWDRVEKLIPPELNRDILTISVENEQRGYTGWGPASNPNDPDWQKRIPGFTGWADVLGTQALYRAIEADKRGLKYRAFAFSGGNPEEGWWGAEGVDIFLKYCATVNMNRPNSIGLALHEYSFTLNLQDGMGDLLGRFKRLLDHCDQTGIPYPPIFIKEFGWTERDAPAADEAMRQLASVADMYAAVPAIEGLALWTTQEGWSGLNQKIVALVQPLTEFAKTYRYTGELRLGPSLVPMPPSKNMLENPSFEEGWTDVQPAPDRIQQPNGWNGRTWGIGEASPFYNLKMGGYPTITGIPESTHKLASQLPPNEQLGAPNALILEGRTTYKMLQAVNMVAARQISQTVTGLPPNATVKLTVPVQVHYQNILNADSPDDTQVKIRCGEMLKIVYAQSLYAVDSLPDRQWAYITLTSTADATGSVYVEITVGTVWQNSRDIFIDAVELEIVSEPIDPEPSECFGAAREQYRRTYWVAPSALPAESREYIYAEAHRKQVTVGPSFDDAGIGDLQDKTAVLWGIPLAEQQTYLNWYATNYPGTVVQFKEVPPITGGGFRPTVKYRPCNETTITQKFGVNPQNYPMWGDCGHEGVDVSVSAGRPFYAVQSGRVVHASNLRWTGTAVSSYGYHVVIKHVEDNHTWYSVYAHATPNLPVSAGQFVSAGQIVGYSGNTGNSTGYHLHFSMLIDQHVGCHPQTMYGYFIDPLYVMTYPAPSGGTGYRYDGPAVTYADAIHAPADDWRWPAVYGMIDRVGTSVKFMSNGQSPEWFKRYSARPFHLVRLFRKFNSPVSQDTVYNDWKNEIQKFWVVGARRFEVHNEPNLASEGNGVVWNGGAEFAEFMKPIIIGLRKDFAGIKLYFPGMSPGVPWESQLTFTVPAWEILKPYCSGFCLHAYSGNNENAQTAATEIVAQAVGMQERLNLQVPLVISESSVNRGMNYQQKADAYKLVNERLAGRPGVEAAVWYISDWYSPPPEQAAHGESWYGTPMPELYQRYRG